MEKILGTELVWLLTGFSFCFSGGRLGVGEGRERRDPLIEELRDCALLNRIE